MAMTVREFVSTLHDGLTLSIRVVNKCGTKEFERCEVKEHKLYSIITGMPLKECVFDRNILKVAPFFDSLCGIIIRIDVDVENMICQHPIFRCNVTESYFKELKVGDSFIFHGIKFLKILDRDVPDRLSCETGKPNCLNLNNKHLCTLMNKAIVDKIIE